MKNELEKEYKSNTKETEALRKNFPSCFDKEGNFNIEKFQSLIGEDTNIVKEGYKLDWLGKSYSRLLVNTPVTTILTEDKLHNELEENKNSNNLYIEGDNLEVLKHLTNACSEKVKMIYIDPPYNTGTDFIYQDDRKFTVEELSKMANINEEESKRVLDFTNSKSNSHSAWLTFMYPRLYIARELLKEDGVIFISIDDNEQAQLKLLCDEIFGEENFMNELVWINKKSGRLTSESGFSKTNEKIFVYSKSLFVNYENTISRGQITEKMSDMYSGVELKIEIDEYGEYIATHELYHRGSKFDSVSSPTMVFPIFVNMETNEITTKDVSDELNFVKFEAPVNEKGNINAWRWSKKKIEEEPYNLVVKNGKIYSKRRNFNDMRKKDIISSWTTQNGGEDLISILNAKTFDYPKPVELISFLIGANNGLILDFFSGSSTTAHAVMQLNAEDNGNRKFIMVQLPEVIDSKNSKSAFDFCIDNNLEPIIPSIAKERIKRASRKIIEENKDKEYIENIDFGFKAFKTEELENSNYLNELEAFDSGQGNLLGGNLSKQDLYNLALTWKTHDGVELTNSFKEVLFNEYKGLMVENKLYLMFNDFNTECLRKVLEFNDSSSSDDIINNIIIYGYNFSSQSIKELSEGIKVRNKKSAEIELEVRF